VADVAWMEHRFDTNKSFVTQLLGYSSWAVQDEDENKPTHFFDGGKKINFVEVSKDIRDNFRYDMYFFGGGEVFAESRGFHGGWNYYLRYLFALYTKPFVLLGGIETPTTVWQKLLYKYLLPKAHSIVCREKASYQTALMYHPKSVLYQDFAVPLLHAYLHHYKHPRHIAGLTDKDHPRYLLINMVPSMATEESFAKIKQCIEQYNDCQLIYVHGGEQDRPYGEWMIGAYPDTQIYDWTEHSLQDTLTLFAYAQAGIGCRLHFLLLLQELNIPRYALVYAEKVSKLVTSTIELESNK
jgi:polysaccharide pyruvyl transferase WcaK-like protein